MGCHISIIDFRSAIKITRDEGRRNETMDDGRPLRWDDGRNGPNGQKEEERPKDRGQPVALPGNTLNDAQEKIAK
jgi:hypothetical protein